MTTKIIVLVLIFWMNFHSVSSQILACGYRNDSNYGYICDLLLYNPSGTYNFSRISGTHLPGKTDEDVLYIESTSDSNSTNVPSIICDTFINTIGFSISSIGIEYIDKSTFKNCKKVEWLNFKYNKIAKIDEKAFSENLDLRELHLNSNRLTTLPENIFANQHNITFLDLMNNQIADLPKNIFRTLKQVQTLYLTDNKLKVFHAFGFSSNLTYVDLAYNQIEAFDQNFIDDTGVEFLDMTNNLCANVSIKDTSPSRLQMRMLLVKCFDNYLNLFPGEDQNYFFLFFLSLILVHFYKFTDTTTTTAVTTSSTTTEVTLPPECVEGDLDERVCRLEDTNEKFQENFYNHDRLINELQDKINELANRPCACQQNLL